MSVVSNLQRKYETAELSWEINPRNRSYRNRKTWTYANSYCRVMIAQYDVNDYELSVIYLRNANRNNDGKLRGDLSKITRAFKKSNLTWKIPVPDIPGFNRSLHSVSA